jgi:hypothetical protein
MPTQKKRVNVTLSKPIYHAIGQLAKRDDMPYATKAAQLLEEALELQEDIVLGNLARQRELKSARYVPHEEVWAKYGI